MVKILFTGASCNVNKGATAMVICASKSIREFIPDAKFTLMSWYPPNYVDIDTNNCKNYNVRVVQGISLTKKTIFSTSIRIFRAVMWKIIKNCTGLDLSLLLNDKILREYHNTDLIVDLSGDGFATYQMLIGAIIDKPIVIYAQSIDPTIVRLRGEIMSKFILNRCAMIIARGPLTVKYLNTIIKNTHIYFTADSAFILKPVSDEQLSEILRNEGISNKLNQNKPLIGISISQSIENLSHLLSIEKEEGGVKLSSFPEMMVKLIDYLIMELNANIIMIPHVIGPGKDNDDRIIANKIFKRISNKDRVIAINTDYGPEELKGIISKCDIFIGSRMHANIAALSTYVPVMAISYNPKTLEIMKMAGQEKYVCDFKTITYEELKLKVNDVWENREKIRNELKENVKVLQEKALYNAQLVKELLDSLNKSAD